MKLGLKGSLIDSDHGGDNHLINDLHALPGDRCSDLFEHLVDLVLHGALFYLEAAGLQESVLLDTLCLGRALGPELVKDLLDQLLDDLELEEVERAWLSCKQVRGSQGSYQRAGLPGKGRGGGDRRNGEKGIAVEEVERLLLGQKFLIEREVKLEGLIGKAQWSWEGGDREVRVQHERQEFKLV